MCRSRRAIAAVTLALCCAFAHADTLTGRVIAIADGDTITVLDAVNARHKIRLAGIDAPERGQPFGSAARQHLARQVAGKAVRVVHNKIDRYGRLVGQVAADGADINLGQIAAGLAWHYKAYAGEQSPADRAAYAAAERAARAARRGLWRDTEAVPPWEWRRRKVAVPPAPTISRPQPPAPG